VGAEADRSVLQNTNSWQLAYHKKNIQWMGLGAAMANDMIEWWQQWPMIWLWGAE
jgi:hypothetical protein